MAKRIFVAEEQLTAAQVNEEVKTTFGGDGSDGALSISSGTTTIDCGGAAVVIKQYTSISITGTGKLAFSNPHANGTIIILKSQGNVTLTSSQAPMIDCSSMGGIGGTASLQGVGAGDGNNGSDGLGFLITVTKGTAVRASSNAGGAATLKPQLTTYASKYYMVAPGSGGASGMYSVSNGNGTPGSGGRGGGALVIECGGAWNFTTAGGISVAAANGGNAANGTSTQLALGGGSGGGGGCVLILYNSLTANSGTITLTAGSGGNAFSTGIGSGLGSPHGASAGGSVLNAGSASSQGSDTAAPNGVAGGTGLSVVALNEDIA